MSFFKNLFNVNFGSKFLSLPSKKLKPLGFLTYSLILFFFSIFGDKLTKIIFWIFAAVSFIFAAIPYLNKKIDIPLIPCKNRCNEKEKRGICCLRGGGFTLGLFFSSGFIGFIKLIEYNISNLNKSLFLFIGIALTFVTWIHGTLRRYFQLLNKDTAFNKFLTFIAGLFTGLGVLFMGLFFIL